MAERKRRNVLVEGEKLRGAEKVKLIPLKVIPTDELPKKPDWIRVKIPASPKINHIKQKLREHKLAAGGEEAAGPKRGEGGSNGTATGRRRGERGKRRGKGGEGANGKPKEGEEKEKREREEEREERGRSEGGRK